MMIFLLLLGINPGGHDEIINKGGAMPEIMVLSTLHQLHGKVKYYTYEDLSKIIEKFKPDMLAVELRPVDVEKRIEQPVKQEYQYSVYPLIDKLKCKVVPLEPSEPKYSELVELYKKSSEELQKNNPEALKQFGIYVNALYEVLLNWWSSPIDVNSSETDRHFEIKHKYQHALFGKDEERGWELWNQHFLKRILDAASECKECRILILVGAEHAYWLRKKLREQKGVKLLNTPRVLEDLLKNNRL